MKNKGFTLVELLGVIVILAAIALVAFPPIVNQIKKSNEKLDKALNEVIFTAGEQYLAEKNYARGGDNVYCIQLKVLVEDGKLSSPVIDSNGKEIMLTRYFKMDYSNTNNNGLVEAAGGNQAAGCKIVIP